MQRAVLHAEAGLGHRPSARDLQTFDPGRDAALDHFGETVRCPRGIIGNPDDRRLAPPRNSPDDVREQRDIVEALARAQQVRAHQADLDAVDMRLDGAEARGDRRP
jgi:hypothetical protein